MNQHKVVMHEVYLFLPLNSDAVTQDDTGHYLHLGAPALHLLERLPLPSTHAEALPAGALARAALPVAQAQGHLAGADARTHAHTCACVLQARSMQRGEGLALLNLSYLASATH